MDDKENSLQSILRDCLIKLNKIDLYEKCFDHLQSEWYNDINDLKLAIDDGFAWSDIKLPGRLKLELKTEILRLTINPKIMSQPLDQQEKTNWIKCYSSEDNCFYYYNSVTSEAQWSEPLEGYTESCDNVKITQTSDHLCVNNDDRVKDLTSKSSKYLLSNVNVKNPMQSIDSLPMFPHTNSLSVYPPIPELQYDIDNGQKIYETPKQNSNITCSEIKQTETNFLHFTKPKSPFKIERKKLVISDVCDSSSVSSKESSDDEDNYDNDDDKEEVIVEADPVLATRLTEMGFEYNDVIYVLKSNNNNPSVAAAVLIRMEKEKADALDQIAKSNNNESNVTDFGSTPTSMSRIYHMDSSTHSVIASPVYESLSDSLVVHASPLTPTKPKSGLFGKINLFS